MEKIIIPDGWYEVSVGTFQELSQLNELEGLHKVIEIVSVLADRDPDEIKNMMPDDFEKVLAAIQWTGQKPTDEYKTSIVIDEVEYCLVKLKSLSLGEWIDLDTWCENSIDNMHKIFAMLYRPIKEVEGDRSELFKEKLMISHVYGTLLFFLIIGNQYQNLIKDYTKD